MENEDKALENRMRNLAVRHKLKLHRYRTRDPLAPEYGLYWLATEDGRISAIGMRLDQIEDVIKQRAEIVKRFVEQRTVEQIMAEVLAAQQ